MNLLQSAILGIIEGVTEFLPISSTGHLILASKIIGLTQTDFVKTFEISIQLGAILSVVALYLKTLLKSFELIKRLLIAFLPTAIIGLAFYKLIKNYLFDNILVVIVSMFLGGLFLILFEYWHREKPGAIENLEKITYKQSLIIGLFQSIAIIPGVSRAAATIIGGLTQNIKRKTIVEFSFLLAVPTMLAATGLDLLKNSSNFSINDFGVLAIGFVTSFIIAIFSIKFLLRFIKNNSFTGFGFYRIILAILFWFFVI